VLGFGSIVDCASRTKTKQFYSTLCRVFSAM